MSGWFFPSDTVRSSPSSPGSSSTPSSGADEEDSRLGFDHEALEKTAKKIKEINSNRYSGEVMRKQEDTRQQELAAEKAHYECIQARGDIDKQRKWAEEQRELYQKQAQAKAQNLRYEDVLARKRMQTDNETQRHHNEELVKMQEQSSLRREQARRATEEQIHAQQRQTEKERAEIERETIRVKRHNFSAHKFWNHYPLMWS